MCNTVSTTTTRERGVCEGVKESSDRERKSEGPREVKNLHKKKRGGSSKDRSVFSPVRIKSRKLRQGVRGLDVFMTLRVDS